MAWIKTNKRNLMASWGGLASLDKMLVIQGFLMNEKEVRNALTTLDARTKAITKPDAFRAYLAQREAALGFSSEVVAAEGWLPPSVFLSHIQAKKPIYDIGAGKNHGWVTHRVQWILIGIFDEEARFLADANTTIADLYADIGSGQARDPQNSSRNLWNDLLDRGGEEPNQSGNGCSPEHLHNQLARLDYPRLHAIWE